MPGAPDEHAYAASDLQICASKQAWLHERSAVLLRCRAGMTTSGPTSAQIMRPTFIDASAPSRLLSNPSVLPTLPFCHVESMHRRLLASLARKNFSQKLTRKSSRDSKPSSFQVCRHRLVRCDWLRSQTSYPSTADSYQGGSWSNSCR